jgi:hypothetical protein
VPATPQGVAQHFAASVATLVRRLASLSTAHDARARSLKRYLRWLAEFASPSAPVYLQHTTATNCRPQRQTAIPSKLSQLVE